MRNPRPYKFSQNIYFDDVISLVRVFHSPDDPLQWVLIDTTKTIDNVLTPGFFDKYAYLFRPLDRANVVAADGQLSITLSKLSETSMTIVQYVIQNKLIIPDTDTFLIASPQQNGKACQISAALTPAKYSKYYFSWDNPNDHPPSADYVGGIPFVFTDYLFFTATIPEYGVTHTGYLSVYDDAYQGWKKIPALSDTIGQGGFSIAAEESSPFATITVRPASEDTMPDKTLLIVGKLKFDIYADKLAADITSIPPQGADAELDVLIDRESVMAVNKLIIPVGEFSTDAGTPPVLTNKIWRKGQELAFYGHKLNGAKWFDVTIFGVSNNG